MAQNQKWTEPMEQRLRELWQSGDSAKACAAALNAEFRTKLSRNSCIGKINRLGAERTCGCPPLKAGSRVPKPKAAPIPKPEVPMPQPQISHRVELVFGDETLELKPVFAGAPEAIMALRPSSCRFPLGDPLKDDFMFCGETTLVGRTYCDCHMGIAYGPGTKSERRATKGILGLAKRASA